jgi:GNAT superfamily N-acetyltransferase
MGFEGLKRMEQSSPSPDPSGQPAVGRRPRTSDRLESVTKTVDMTPADLPAVSLLLGRTYAVLAEREGLSREQKQYLVSERGSVECLTRESRDQRYILAWNRAKIVGVVAVSGDLIGKLYVDPDHHRKGVGRLLYETAERSIRGAGHAKVRLAAFPTAIPFYEKMGLAVVGEKAARGPLAGRSVILMEKVVSRAAT